MRLLFLRLFALSLMCAVAICCFDVVYVYVACLELFGAPLFVCCCCSLLCAVVVAGCLLLLCVPVCASSLLLAVAACSCRRCFLSPVFARGFFFFFFASCLGFCVFVLSLFVVVVFVRCCFSCCR